MSVRVGEMGRLVTPTGKPGWACTRAAYAVVLLLCPPNGRVVVAEEEEEGEEGGGGVGRDCVHQAWTQATACSRDSPVMSARRRTGAWPSMVTCAEEEEVVAASEEDQDQEWEGFRLLSRRACCCCCSGWTGHWPRKPAAVGVVDGTTRRVVGEDGRRKALVAWRRRARAARARPRCMVAVMTRRRVVGCDH